MSVVDFFNSCVSCYKLFIDWLFTYSISGIPVGYIFLACLLFEFFVFYILGGLK